MEVILKYMILRAGTLILVKSSLLNPHFKMLDVVNP